MDRPYVTVKMALMSSRIMTLLTFVCFFLHIKRAVCQRLEIAEIYPDGNILARWVSCKPETKKVSIVYNEIYVVQLWQFFLVRHHSHPKPDPFFLGSPKSTLFMNKGLQHDMIIILIHS